jgi:pimeloyl-ACP methyl ester carboxylesterase
MTLLSYWSVFETIGIILILVFFLSLVVRSAKRNRLKHTVAPKTLYGRIGFSLLYVLRVIGVGVGAFLAVALFILIERNIYSVLTESMPAPSDVDLLPVMPFEVQEVTFAGGDGLTMAGWYVPSQNEATVILLHGYGGNRTAMLWHAEQLVKAGYGVLMYDERASGESQGTRRSYGWEDPRDVQGAIRFIKTEAGNSVEKIGIAGCSIGAQISLQSAAHYPELEAVWADGPSTVRAKDISPSKNPIMALITLGNYSLDWMFEIKLGIDAPAPMIEIIDNISPRPIMLVGGGQPQPLIGSEGDVMLPRYAHYAGSNAQMWVIPEATHCDGPTRRPDEYAKRMIEFFDTALGIKR